MKMNQEKEMNLIDRGKDGMTNWIKEKFTSPFWATFIVAWLICNWETWYITFFVDDKMLFDNHHTLNIDYIKNLYNLNFKDWQKFIFYKDLIYPLIISFFVYFGMSPISDLFYKKSKKDDLKRENYFKDLKDGLKKENIIKKTQEEIWSEEYEKNKNYDYFDKIDRIKNCIFANEGFTHDKKGNEILPINTKATFATEGAVEIYHVDGEGHVNRGNEKIKLTEKGMYILNKYLKNDLEQYKQEKQRRKEARKKVADLSN